MKAVKMVRRLLRDFFNRERGFRTVEPAVWSATMVGRENIPRPQARPTERVKRIVRND